MKQKSIKNQYSALKEYLEIIENKSKYYLIGYFLTHAKYNLIESEGIKEEFAEIIINKTIEKIAGDDS